MVDDNEIFLLLELDLFLINNKKKRRCCRNKIELLIKLECRKL